jgi:5-methylcytosine-specific restriction endonuclease McrA
VTTKSPSASRSGAAGRKRRKYLDKLWWLSRGRVVCALCGRPVTVREDLSVDHVLEVWRGGPEEIGNYRPTHRSCNNRRSNPPGAGRHADRAGVGGGVVVMKKLRGDHDSDVAGEAVTTEISQ